MDHNPEQEVKKERSRGIKLGSQRSKMRRKRVGMGMGKTFDNPQLTQVMQQIDTFQKPNVSEQEVKEAGGMTPKVHARVSKKARAAKALVALAGNEEADPEARKMAQQAIEELGLTAWLDLHQFAEDLRKISQPSQDYDFKKIDHEEMDERLEDLKEEGLHPKVQELAEDYQNLVPLKEQFEEEGPGVTMKTYKHTDGKTYRVNEDSITDVGGKPVMFTNPGKDLRAGNTVANHISTFLLDDIDEEKAKRGGEILATIMPNASGVMGKMYGYALDRMGDMPLGKKAQMSYAEQKHKMNMSNPELTM